MELPADSQPRINDSPLTPLGERLLLEHAEQFVKPELIEPATSATTPPSILLLWLAVPVFLIDLTLGPVSILEFNARGPMQRGLVTMVLGFWMGLIAAQGTLWSLCFVLSPESLRRRLAVLLPQFIACGAAGLAGFAFVHWYEEWTIDEREWWENGARFYCILPIVVVAGQTPFFACRFWGWSIRRKSSPAETPQPISIAQLLVATAVVAASFAMVRAAPTSTLGEPEMIWQFVAVFGCIAAGFSLLGGVPLMILLHYVRQPLPRLAWMIGLLFAGFCVSCFLYGYFTSWQQLLHEVAFNTLIFGIIIVTFLCGLGSCFAVLRRLGWTIAPR